MKKYFEEYKNEFDKEVENFFIENKLSKDGGFIKLCACSYAMDKMAKKYGADFRAAFSFPFIKGYEFSVRNAELSRKYLI